MREGGGDKNKTREHNIYSLAVETIIAASSTLGYLLLVCSNIKQKTPDITTLTRRMDTVMPIKIGVPKYSVFCLTPKM